MVRHKCDKLSQVRLWRVGVFLWLYLGVSLWGALAWAESNSWTSYSDWSSGARRNVLLDSSDAIKLPYKAPSSRVIETPFLYVPNSSRNMIVKMRTDNGAIVWTYKLADLNVGSSPSRTTVDSVGNVWIAMRNSNYVVVLTSEGKLLSKIDIGGYGPRAITIDKQGKIWVGAMQGKTMVQIAYDPAIKDYKVVHRIYAPNFCPYGATTDSYGNVWVVNSYWYSGCYPGVTKINASTGQIIQWIPAEGVSGIAADLNGNVWVSSYTKSEAHQIKASTGAILKTYDTVNRARGVSVDVNGKVWIACSKSRDNTMDVRHLVKIDPITQSLTSLTNVGMHTIGVAADLQGYVWANSLQEGLSYKINATTGALVSTHSACDTTGLKPCLCGDGRACSGCRCSNSSDSGPYTYSDMTGLQIKMNIEPQLGTWQASLDTCCSAIFTSATADADIPPGTFVLVRARTANATSSLSSAIWGPYVELGLPLQVPPNRAIEVQVLLKTKDSRITPLVKGLNIHYNYFNSCTTKRVNGTCQDLCPTTCKTDYDCDVYRCGQRTRCLAGQCVDPSYKTQCQPPNLLFVLDSSCSMADGGDQLVDSGSACTTTFECPDSLQHAAKTECKTSASKGYATCHYTRWDTAVRALTRVVNDYGGSASFSYKDRRVRFGLVTFASNATLQAQLYTNPDSMATKISTLVPNGGTNYTNGLKKAYDHINTKMGTDAIKNRKNAVLFVTDGYPQEDGCTTPQTEIERLYNMPDGNGGTRKIKTYIIGFGSGTDSSAKTCLTNLAKKGRTDRSTTCTSGTCLSYYAADNAAALIDAIQDIINNATEEICDGLDNDCDGRVDNTTADGGCLCSKSFAKPAPTTLVNTASVDYNTNSVRLYTFMANATNQGYCKGLPKKNDKDVARLYDEICRNNQRKALGCAGNISNPDSDAYDTYCGRCCGKSKANLCYWPSGHTCKATPWTASSASSCYSQCTGFCQQYKMQALNCLAPRGQLLRSGSGYNTTGNLTVRTQPTYLGEWLSFQSRRYLFANLPTKDYRPSGSTNLGHLMVSLAPNNFSAPTSVSGTVGTWYHKFEPSNSYLTHEMLGIKTSDCKTTAECARERRETIDLVRGYTDSGKLSRMYRLGPVYHSNPAVVGPPTNNNSDPQYQQWLSSTISGQPLRQRPPIVYVASNDGVMHAFLVNAAVAGRPAEDTLKNMYQNGTNTGTKLVELWGFIPKTILSKVRAGTNGARAGGGRLYTLDGSPVVKNVQMYRYVTSGAVQAKWRTVMVFGMGAGGRGYVAIDVTNPYKPLLLWEINNESYKDPSNQLLGKFDRMGYTMAKPLIANLLVNWGGRLQERAVAVLSGGLAIKERNTPPNYVMDRNHTQIGNVVYVVDLETGRLIRELIPPPPRLATPSFKIMSVTGSPVGFGALPALTSRIFIGDVRGRILRFDTQNTNPITWQLKVFHDLYDSSAITTSAQASAIVRSPIMNAPALALNQRGELVILGGTGDRLNFDLIGGSNKVFSLRENLSLNAALDPTSGEILQDNVVAVNNYVVDLNKSMSVDSNGIPTAQFTASGVTGERMTGDPVIFDGTAYFTTYTPTSRLPICGVPGFARIYGLHFDDMCRTTSCWQGLLAQGNLTTAITPVRCCEKGAGTSGTCDSLDTDAWTDTQQRNQLVANGAGFCNDLSFTLPRLVDPVIPPQYYRFRMLGNNTISLGPSFTFQPGETIVQRVNASDASKGHKVQITRKGRYFLSFQVSGRQQASDNNHRLQRMQVVTPSTEEAKKPGNFFTIDVNQKIPSVFVASWSALLD